MARSFPSTDVAIAMLRDLMAAEALVGVLAGTAPVTMAEVGGAQALVAERGRPTGAGFWSVAPLPDALWERMASEHARAAYVWSRDS